MIPAHGNSSLHSLLIFYLRDPNEGRQLKMAFVYCNPNPDRLLVGDCVIRAISILKDQSWLETYDDVTCLGREMYDMPPQMPYGTPT